MNILSKLFRPRRTIEDHSWEFLSAFEFDWFPDNLTVITNATRGEFDDAVKEFSRRHATGDNARNIEDILRERGYVAVTGLRRCHSDEPQSLPV